MIRFENAFYIFLGKQSVYKESSVETRLDYIRLGWLQFISSPILGNGIGCAGYSMLKEYGKITYLHNNYIELLASGGIIGFTLFYSIYYSVLKKHISIIQELKEVSPMIYISLALLITKLIAHLGTVVYYSKIEHLLFVFWIYMATSIKLKKRI